VASKISIRQISFIALVVFSASIKIAAQCPSGNNTFTGATNTDWNTASNWAQGCVPVPPITGLISIEANCVLSGNTTYVFSLGSTLKVNSGFTLTLNNLATPGVGSIFYEGQTYGTNLMPDGKWWMTQNLNVGIMAASNVEMPNNGAIEKYCYNNDPANCATYSGLYTWNEAMQNQTTNGSKGVCPTGWHIPTDAEWTALENALPSTDKASRLSGNAALWFDGTLKASIHFGSSGFANLPGGFRSSGGSFGLRDNANFWSSTQSNASNVKIRHLDFNVAFGFFAFDESKTSGLSVRCRQN
jgi:uncharacterized protein (TIGR02145 family)